MSMKHYEETLVEGTASSGLVESLEPGTRVAGYVINEVVACGGFATVHRATSERTGEAVAFKLLRPELVLAGTPAKRFRTEAETLARLVHPAIVRILDWGEIAPGMPFIAMEWIAGLTLSDVLRAHGAFSVDEYLGFMEQLGSALSMAHYAGVIHRDIKPSNLMLIPNGDWYDVKLLDFGLAKLLDAGTTAERGLTTTGIMLGTPSYMAPEQLLCQRVDARTDIYALGVLSFMLLTASHPFGGSRGTEIAEMHLSAVPPRVSELVHVPPGVDEAVRMCLEKRPTNRFPTVDALLDSLRRAVRGAATTPEMQKPVKNLFIAFHVTASFCGADEDVDDGVLARIDLCLEDALDVLTRAGMIASLSTGNAFVATREAKVVQREHALEEREAAILLAVSILRELTTALASTPDVHCSVAVNVTDDRARLKETRWMMRNPWNVVVATEEAVAGIEDRYVLQPVPGAPERRIVVRKAFASMEAGGASP